MSLAAPTDRGTDKALELLPWDPLELEPPLTVSEWADRYRVLSDKTSALPGPWRTALTPYLREPMDAFTDPVVREVVLKAATQVGKTEVVLNCLGYLLDCDPGPTMIVLPRDEDAKGWADRRVKDMVDVTAKLRAHVTGKEDDLAGKVYRFKSMFIKFAGANSASDLASDPCRYVFFDEINKYPKISSKEADPIGLGTKRTITFWDHKLIKISSPTVAQEGISVHFTRTDQRRYWVPCPLCGEYQPLVFSPEDNGPGRGCLVWEEGLSPEEIEKRQAVGYQCGRCGDRFPESAKAEMNRRGVWCPEGARVLPEGQIDGPVRSTAARGYHIPALYSPMVTWGRIVREFLEAKDEPLTLKAWVNGFCAEDWIERTVATKSDHLKDRIGEYPLGQVPRGAVTLTAGVDVQLDHFWLVIRAWGIGEESWLIRYDRLERFEDVADALFSTVYPSVEPETEPFPVRLACIDSGYRTNEVYQWCRQHPDRLRPLKGYDHLAAATLRASVLEKDGRGRPLKGGLLLWTFDVTYYKDKLNRLIHATPGAPGQWHLPQGLGEEYFRHLTAEHKVLVKDRKGRTSTEWRLVSDKRANHLLDCEVGALVGADMLKIYLLREGSGPTVYRGVPGRRRTINQGVNV